MRTSAIAALIALLGCRLDVCAYVKLSYEVPRARHGASLGRRDAISVDVFPLPSALLSTILVNGSIGTPSQDLILVPVPNVDAFAIRPLDLDNCEGLDLGCDQIGAYIPANSETFRVLDEEPNPNALSNSSVLFTDKLSIGGVGIENVEMVLVPPRSDLITGPLRYLGLGPNSTVLNAMVAGGQINSKAYSWWYDSTEVINFTTTDFGNCNPGVGPSNCAPAPTVGSLLFGAVDNAKFDGNLLRMDMKVKPVEDKSPDISPDWDLSVMLNDITVSNSSTPEPLSVMSTPIDLNVLYHGWSYLPYDITAKIWETAGAVIDDPESGKLAFARIACDAATRYPEFSAKLRFGGACGPEVAITMADLVLISDALEAEPSMFPDPEDPSKETEWCPCSLLPTESLGNELESFAWRARLSTSIMGRLYMVLDFENNEIGIAQAKVSDEDDVVEFGEKGDKIPGTVKVDAEAAGSECQQAGTAGTQNGDNGDDESNSVKSGPVTIGIWALYVALGIFLLFEQQI